MTDTQNKGDLGQIAAKWAFALNGYSILIPLSDGLPYDFVAHKEPGEFIRVQAKYKESWKPKNKRRGENIHLSKRDGVERYTKDTVDVIVIYVNQSDEVFYVPVEHVENLKSVTFNKSTVDKWKVFPYNTKSTKNTCGTLRTIPPRNTLNH